MKILPHDPSSHIIMNEDLWLDLKTALQLLGISRQAFYKNAAYKTRKDETGKTMVALSSLPLTVQVRYWEEQHHKNQVLCEPADCTDIPEHEKELTLAKFDLLKLYQQSFEREYGHTLQAKKNFIKEYNSGKYPKLFEKIGPVSFRTLELWRQKLEKHKDPFCLARKYQRRKKGRKVHKKAAPIILSKALSPNQLRVSEVIRLVKDELQEKVELPSDRTIRRWLEDWKQKHFDLWVFYRNGQKALNDRVLPYIERDYDKIQVGDVLVADGHVLNFEIINPFTGRPKRMVLILVYDMKSNFPLGWEIMPTENTQAIASAFRRGILRLGFLPRVFYIDNGKAFRSKFFKGVDDFRTEGVTGLFERLGCQVIHAWSYHGQSKTVERFFGTFTELERLMPTYTGTSIEKKPAHLKRNEKWHQRLHQALTHGAGMDLKEAHLTIAYWFAEYVQRPQSGHLNGKSPLQVFSEDIEKIRHSPDFETRKVDEAGLRYLMMSTSVRTLYRNGIRFLGSYYYNDELYAYEKGRGTQFIIRYDLDDLNRILVYLPDGRFLCEAERTEKVHPAARALGNDQDEQKLGLAVQQKQRLNKQTQQIARAFLEHIHSNTSPDTIPISKAQSQSKKENIDLSKLLPEQDQSERKLYLFACDKERELKKASGE